MLTIKQLRKKIEKTDVAIIKKLAQRQRLVIKIGKLKAKSGKSITDIKREKVLALLHGQASTQQGLQKNFVKRVFKIIIAYSRKQQC